MANQTTHTTASASRTSTQGRQGSSRTPLQSAPRQQAPQRRCQSPVTRRKNVQEKKAGVRRRAAATTGVAMAASTAATEAAMARVTSKLASCEVGEEADEGAEPRALPEHIRRTVPAFDVCGRQNCGGHPEKQPWWSWLYPATTCHKCFWPARPQDMHALPCGHALCAGCLEQAVAHIEASVRDEGPWAEVAEHLEEHWAQMESSESQDDGTSSSRPAGNATTALGRAMAAAGFYCCGQNMRLERYMGCMAPRTARAFWLAYEAIRWPLDMTRNRCGWPDCGQFVAPTCSYGRDGGTVYHCVECKGNSLVIRRGNLIPAR